MKTEHTPGPLKAVEERQTFRVGGKDCVVGIDIMAGTEAIARVHNLGGDRLKEMQANACLIAAAPETAAERDRLKAVNAEMLEALKAVVQQLNACLDALNEFQDSETAPEWIKENSATRFICGDPAIVQARAAIAKAEAL